MNDIRLVGSQRKATENTAGQYAYKFFLAALADLYDGCPNPDDFPFSSEKGYEVFDHLEADDPPKKVKRPITITRDAKSMLGALFASIVSVINDTGKTPAGGIKAHLANSRTTRADQVLFMINTAEALWPTIHAGHLERNFDSVACFRAKLESLVADKASVDPGADELARIFVRFLKCVVWFTANFAVEAKVTLNGKHLRSVIRCFGSLPNVVFDEGMTEFFDNQLAWIEENDTVRPAKAAAPKAAAPKAAPKAAAPKAAPQAAPPGRVALNGKHLRGVNQCFGGLPNVVEDEVEVEAEEARPEAVPDLAPPPPAATPTPVAEPAPSAGKFSYDDLMADITKM